MSASGYGQVPQPPPRTVRQEVAPKGGFAPINVARNVPSSIGRGAGPLLLLAAGVMGWGFYRVGQTNIRRRILKREKKDIRLAITPLLQAEEDARFVIARQKHHEWEAEVMKDVPGWKVGENVYKTRKFMPPVDRGPAFSHD